MVLKTIFGAYKILLSLLPPLIDTQVNLYTYTDSMPIKIIQIKFYPRSTCLVATHRRLYPRRHIERPKIETTLQIFYRIPYIIYSLKLLKLRHIMFFIHRLFDFVYLSCLLWNVFSIILPWYPIFGLSGTLPQLVWK